MRQYQFWLFVWAVVCYSQRVDSMSISLQAPGSINFGALPSRNLKAVTACMPLTPCLVVMTASPICVNLPCPRIDCATACQLVRRGRNLTIACDYPQSPIVPCMWHADSLQTLGLPCSSFPHPPTFKRWSMPRQDSWPAQRLLVSVKIRAPQSEVHQLETSFLLHESIAAASGGPGLLWWLRGFDAGR